MGVFFSLLDSHAFDIHSLSYDAHHILIYIALNITELLFSRVCDTQ